MAIATTGGSGSSTLSLSANTASSTTLFTTPSTTDAIFIVTVTWSGLSGTPATTAWVTCNGVGSAYLGGNSAPTVDSGGTLVIKVGPNTPVIVTWGCGNSAAATVYYSYNWLGVVVT